METTKNNKNGIIGILNRAREYNLQIGNYEEHFINEQFNFTVRLSNGQIVVPRTMAQDQEVQPSSITEDRIKRVANNFQNNNPSPRQQTAKANTTRPIKSEQKLSFWYKIMQFLGIK